MIRVVVPEIPLKNFSWSLTSAKTSEIGRLMEARTKTLAMLKTCALLAVGRASNFRGFRHAERPGTRGRIGERGDFTKKSSPGAFVRPANP
jgi:hypothetical protein